MPFRLPPPAMLQCHFVTAGPIARPSLRKMQFMWSKYHQWVLKEPAALSGFTLYETFRSSCASAWASPIYGGCDLFLELQAQRCQICTFFPNATGLMALSSSSPPLPPPSSYLTISHILNASLRAHYRVMSSVLLLAKVQQSGVLVWKKPS